MVSEFRVFQVEAQEVRDLIQLNLGGKRITEFDLQRIRIPAGGTKHWTIPTLEGEEAVKSIEGIMVFFKDVRAWWPDTEPTGKPPECRSDNAETGFGTRWDGDDPDAPHDCDTCKYAAWESDPKGGRGQWCKQMRAIFILRRETFLPTVLFLPPTSLKEGQKYVMRLLDHGVPYYGAITAWDLVEDKSQEGQLFNRAVPRVVCQLDKAARDQVQAYVKYIQPSFEKVKIENDEDYYGNNPEAPPEG